MTSGTRPDRDLEKLIAEFQRSGLRELHVRRDGVEIYLSQDGGAAGLDAPANVVRTVAADDARPAPAAVAAPQASPTAPPAELPAGAVIVPAPYLGTFYRSAKPGQPPFVEIGEQVEAETELCLVEVMKLFTAVRAGNAGTVHSVLAKDGEMVAADQPLFVIVPA